MAEIPNADCRFRGGATAYAAYLDTPEGRLRSDLAFANIQEFVTPGRRGLHALDLGSGNGAMALRLAHIGFHVTLLDSSPQMLDLATSSASEAGMSASIAVHEGDVNRAAILFHDRFFDLIVCHNLLEFVDDPEAVLRAASKLMRTGSLLSVLVRTQAGEVLKAAIRAGDLGVAETVLSTGWARESLFGGPVRLFELEAVNEMLHRTGLTTSAVRGVRVVSDYLPPTISRETGYERILALERKLGSRAEFTPMARYVQILARPTKTALPPDITP